MAKKKFGSASSIITAFVMIFGALAACSIFMPFIINKITVLGADAGTPAISGMEFIKCLFAGNKLTSDTNPYITLFLANFETFKAATTVAEVAAIGLAVTGALVFVFGFLFLLCRTKFFRTLILVCSFLAFACAISALASILVIGSKLSADAGMLGGSVVTIGAGVIIAIVGSLLSFGGILAVKTK